jgi:hypothetical protein
MDSSIEIYATEQDRSFWLGQGLAHQNFGEVSAAEILIVPLKDFREGVPFAFHQDTASFARYLAKSLVGQAKIEVLADDEEYIEIALHGASFRFSTIVVGYVLAPLLINLLSSYIYDVLKAKPSDSVEMSLVIEDHDCRAMRVGFKGEAKDFALIADKVSQISRECMAAKTDEPRSSKSTGANEKTAETKSHELPDEQF